MSKAWPKSVTEALLLPPEKLKHTKKRSHIRWLLAVEYGLVCQLCSGAIESFEVATIDHIIPRGRGGKDRVSNWQLAHRECNEIKGHMLPEEWEFYKPLLLEGLRVKAGATALL